MAVWLAEVDNVQKFGVPEDHTFFLRLRCLNCSDVSPNAVGISREMEVEGIRGASVNVQVEITATTILTPARS